jgi:hypothetical protein
MAAAPRASTPQLRGGGITSSPPPSACPCTWWSKRVAPGPLGDRLNLDGPFEALHLSCHGDIARRGPVLALEDETGARALTTISQLVGALSDPARWFSCRPVGRPSWLTWPPQRTLRARTHPRRHPCCTGLGRFGLTATPSPLPSTSMANLPATGATRCSRRCPAGSAPASPGDPAEGRHWHLARLYLGPDGGGALAAGASQSASRPAARNSSSTLPTSRCPSQGGRVRRAQTPHSGCDPRLSER